MNPEIFIVQGIEKMIEHKHNETNEETTGKVKLSPFGHLFRFIGWWFGFTGLYAMFSVCPFCGRQGCPVGLASAGTVGALLSLCLQDWKRLFALLKQKLKVAG
jgi:hypothetical protein